MTKEDVAKQFFWDFLENLGDSSDDERVEEEANFVLTDLFFSGLLKVEWNPKTHSLGLGFQERECEDHAPKTNNMKQALDRRERALK